MKWSLFALILGACIDLIVGDPHSLPHPVVAIGKLISLLERLFRRLCPKTKGGEITAGALIWIAMLVQPNAAPQTAPAGARERDVLADPCRKVAARREHEGLYGA